MKIIEFYKSVLSAGNMIADDQDRISIQFDGQSLPATVSGKRMVLPTKAHMSDEGKEEVVLFHPLKENILSGESPLMAKYRQSVNVRTNYAIQNLTAQLILMGISPGLHSKLPPEQLDFIKLFKDADERTFDVWGNLRKAMPLGNVDKCFVRIYMKSKANIRGRVHRRGAIVSFPFYEELIQAIAKNEKVVWGVRVDRKKDMQFFKALFEHMFPGIGEEGSYSRGSVSDLAPTLDAMLRGVAAVAECINGFVADFSGVLDDIKELAIDASWMESLDNLEQFSAELRLIPMQAGNDAAVETKTVEPPQHLNGWTPPQLRQVQQPTPVSNEPQRTSSGKLDFSSLSRNLMPQQAPVYSQQGFGQQGYGQPWGAPPPPRSGPPSWDRAGGFGAAPTMAQAGGWGNSFRGNDL